MLKEVEVTIQGKDKRKGSASRVQHFEPMKQQIIPDDRFKYTPRLEKYLNLKDPRYDDFIGQSEEMIRHKNKKVQSDRRKKRKKKKPVQEFTVNVRQ